MEYETVIGLEIHAQLLTKSKIFCKCTTKFGAEPNTNTCPVCLGMPGVLPVLNKKVVEYAIKTGLVLNCEIARHSVLARKNYFYPDLPKGYQISQYELPLATGGYIDIEVGEKLKRIGIIRAHIEEDAGKLMHEIGGGVTGSSYVDFNRTGVPLIEIVSEPDISSAEEASIYLQTLRTILRYLEVCDGNMEEGSLLCDANVSVRPKGEKTLGTRTELKNMNSFRFVRMALEYEAQRQIDLLDSAGSVVQETRLWDSRQGITISMRRKEEAHDYRYFPDPDLVPIEPNEEWIEKIKGSLPELPREKKERFVREYSIPAYDSGVLTSSKTLAEYFEECVKKFPQPKT
ncbi:MAG: Asp-tRNA(Asn)/Glu-tRNA(Gln) amidotransferase subunit GatB, partial [Deltaproteobacteria bacterium]|nr:Asp-tRNA(Asn)/Glu-tRNA(Gln) amidotransferase subunit GatB [Deltaproteobacteria bacterium]